jgi:hypothetical protein
MTLAAAYHDTSLVTASSSMACAATQAVRNVIASRVFLRRSNLPLVSRRLLHFVRNDRFLSSVSEAVPTVEGVIFHRLALCAVEQPAREGMAQELW